MDPGSRGDPLPHPRDPANAMTRYDALYLLSAPLTAPLFLSRYAFRSKYHDSLPAMLGKRLPDAPPAANDGRRPRVWIHAVSVGEVVAAHSVIGPLKQALPSAMVIVSTVTETGQATAGYGKLLKIESIQCDGIDSDFRQLKDELKSVITRLKDLNFRNLSLIRPLGIGGCI